MSERRLDPTTGRWTTFATHRQARTFLPAADECPLCPTSPGGPATEIPAATFDIVVFDNRFPSMVSDPPEPSIAGSGPYVVEPGQGATEVVVYTADHNATLATVDVDVVLRLVDVWAHRYQELGRRPEVDYVFIFENKGEVIGVTLHHPHGQIYGYPEIPPIPRSELDTAAAYQAAHGRCVHCDVLAHELTAGARVVAESDDAVAFVPFAARFPYEVHILPRRHVAALPDLSPSERRGFAAVLRTVVRGYDALFGFSLPYVMSMHQAPTDGGSWADICHLHLELTPPHRTATKLKYLAGSELGAGAFINDTLPEHTARELRAALDTAAVT